jgi:hypothetical protein
MQVLNSFWLPNANRVREYETVSDKSTCMIGSAIKGFKFGIFLFWHFQVIASITFHQIMEQSFFQTFPFDL